MSFKTDNFSEYQPGHSKSCLEKFGKEALAMNGVNPYVTPLSPGSSNESSSSSSGDIHVGQELHSREEGFGSLDVGGKQGYSSIESPHAKDNEDGSRHHISTEKNLSSSSLDSTDDGNKSSNGVPENAQYKNVGPDSYKGEDHIENDVLSLLPDLESDPCIWIPPEPENMEDDKPSIADNYEDDEYSSTDWKQPSSFSSLDEHQGVNHSYREKRQKAMLEAMNGQFKILVSRFLASEGIAFSIIDDGQSWVDIVASLSWKAALLVKPDATAGRAMDPGSYVKVKCIASGSRQQSELIKGLVFKKNAAHKHMPTKFKNPKLLLLQGTLGNSAVGLSSFDSMEQEKDYLKSITEMIEACHPNVVLVEKNISRDIQESLIEKGITVVSDMKIHRLQRISLCTGSPIISCSNFPAKLILPQCESFHIERFVEEYNSTGECGKRSSKTLMFLEGFQKPLGCTILLKGAESDELKKVKRVVQYTVFAAYHLILETSFFADQRVFFSDNSAVRGGNLDSSLESSLSSMASENALDVPICNGSFSRFDTAMTTLNANLQYTLSDISGCVNFHMLNSSESVPSPPLLSPFSISHEKFQGDNNLPTLESASPNIALSNNTFDDESVGLHASLGDNETSMDSSISEEKKLDDGISTKTGPVGESIEAIDDDACNTVKRKHDDEIENVLDSQSILVLLSKQCRTKGTICEQSHLSRIKYYGYFDISLGRFLKDILLDQNCCSSCGEAPESHVYCYTHQNGNLSVHVRQLPAELRLPGEAEGKIWMWTHCLRCKNGSQIPTRRVVLSSSARSLSFGKFLELSFSGHSAASRLSECGHSLHRDFLRFFGLGSKVALFVYSSVKIYTACKPPPVLNFYDPKGYEWLKREMELVLFRGRSFFSEVSDMLQNLKPRYSGALANTKLSGSLKDFPEVEDMLILEKSEFEASLLKAIDQSRQIEISLHDVLSLKWLNQELLLMLYIWDRRLDCLLQHAKFQQEKEVHAVDDQIPIIHSHENEQPSSPGSYHSQHMQIDLDSESTEINVDISHSSSEFVEFEKSNGLLTDRPGTEYLTSVLEHIPYKSGNLPSPHEDNPRGRVAYLPISEDIEIVKEPYIEKPTDSEHKTVEAVGGADMPSSSSSNENSSTLNDNYSKSEGPAEMIWASFSDLRREYRKDLYGGSLRNFEFVNAYKPSHLSPLYQPSGDETELLHFPFGPCGNVLSVSKDEISSIIACALALSEDQRGLLERVESEPGEIFKSYSLTSEGSGISARWSSTGFSELDGINVSNSAASLSSDESSTSISDGLLSVDQLLASSDNLHPEVAVGMDKFSGKSIFSVVCIYAKQFYKLRKKCCPSELAYISSLSRCKKWDAQGGKSKAFFAKTLDDRFIIKQIKRTELDSFLKFGPDYFKHVFHSLDSGSQTCLAKILGIYQVRQNKSGKEIKTDLMVMENLLYGHKISQTYDLKGSVFGRYIQDVKHGEKVLLDQNFVEDMHKSPIYLGGKTKHLLQRAIWNDTSFLTSINVMDYSLLVGVDDERRELVFGIIDYLRQYTWDKQLETWVKSSMVVPKNELPTVISPKEYKKRFRKFMARYFLAVPHSWNCEHCSPSCKFCVDGKRYSAKVHNAELSEQS
ncbi:1-phosphatidylinositol-3-phosphate 5-kinase FAB1A-like isoform X1 [Canna indica]|uniref:1-phosphatidylinositol-3-phosphate 5-kinase n=1 Tax=Canna indica TaxID=4628 RepID=A0AAQ3JS59_9LILI|nr:1-phosphatidylinositol-3-phosphate 5-kinase FAB1A-like isoform X1 [Canna indica]